MSQKRHTVQGASIAVRARPATFPRDYTSPTHWHQWDQLTYVASGVMYVQADGARWLVPPRRAIWVPAATRHAEQFQGPVTVRTLYFTVGRARRLPRRCRVMDTTSLLHELIVRVSRVSALDVSVPAQARLAGVLIDELSAMSDTPLRLPAPLDARAQRVAASLHSRPDDEATLAVLAERAGASPRTIERLFLAETKMTIGEWRRRLRLIHAVQLLASGAAVSSAALDAGYASPSAFIARFRKTFGTTPARYSAG